MRKLIQTCTLAIIIAVTFTSCYTYTAVVGSGAKGTDKVSKWNNYLIDGLVPLNVSDSKEMAGGATDYTIKISHSFVNGVLAAITFGIYTPTTTTVTK